jgi:hypothetical protein
LPRKSPEEELASFLASLPKYLRLYVQPSENESWTDEDTRAFFESDTARNTQLVRQYEQLLRRCPEEYREYREKKLLMQDLPPIPRGRPRSDADVNESLRLRAAGKSWQQIGTAQGKSRDAVRKLVASRRKSGGK